MTTDTPSVREGDIIEFTLRDERRTAEVMLRSGDDVLLDLFDEDRPAHARLDALADMTVYRPDPAELSVAA